MDVYENLDILGNALPSASVIVGGEPPTWQDGGGVFNTTINIPQNEPYTHTFNIKASTSIHENQKMQFPGVSGSCFSACGNL